MPTTAFALTLLAAALHAGWNLMVKSSGDRLLSALAVTAGAVLVNLPVLALVGLPTAEAIPYLALSALVHTAYILALVRAYQRADFSLAYPIARGMAPLLIAVGGVTLAGDTLSPVGLIGILLVAFGILSLVQLRRGNQRVDAAVITGICIAGYSIIDGMAVRATDESLRYLAALFMLHGALLFAVVLFVRRGERISTEGLGRTFLVGGGGAALAYLLVLIASREAPLGLVSAVRELSVVFGVVAAAVLLREPVGHRHLLAVAAAASGALLIGAS